MFRHDAPTMGNVYVLRYIRDAEGFVVRSERVPLSHADWLSPEEKRKILAGASGAERAEQKWRVEPQTEAFRE